MTEQTKDAMELKYNRKYINDFCDKLLDDDNPLCWQASPIVKQLYECGEADQDRLAAAVKRADEAEAERDELRKEAGQQALDHLATLDEVITLQAENAKLREIVDWFASGDTGLSSEWMVQVCCIIPFHEDWGEGDYPHDPSDFGRCYRLIRSVSKVKENFYKLRDSGPVWAAYVNRWDEMEQLYEEEHPSGKAPKLYSLMQSIRESAQQALAESEKDA